jgi:uncharacterized protein involved in exopolysaccharide biosynthesis
VISKYLEAMFRHKWLLMLPPVLIPLIVAPIAIFMLPPTYQTVTAVMVDKPRYLAATDDISNPWITPAQFQSSRFTEMMQTRSFLNAVASRTSLASLVGNERGETRIRETITRGTQVIPRGDRLVSVGFSAETPQLAFQIANALVEEFRDRSMNERSSQASFALGFVESRLKEAEARLDEENEALRKYVAANPRLTTLDPSRSANSSAAARNGLPTAAIDPQLAELIKNVEIEQREVERARLTLEQARFDASAGIEAQDMRFQVIDPARMPTSPSSDRRKIAMFVALAAVIGLGISAALSVFFVATDRTVRGESDLEGLWDVIGAVPAIGPKGKLHSAPIELARLQVGVLAGARLPAGSEAAR